MELWHNRGTRLATLGYLGHMWELYAMWAWIGAYLAASFAARHQSSQVSASTASLATFAVIAVGALGCVAAGSWADRIGRANVTITAMAVSGCCCLLAGPAFGQHPGLTLAFCLPRWVPRRRGFHTASTHCGTSTLHPPANNVLLPFVLSPATRAVAYLLAAVLMRLLQALADAPDLPDETAEALRRTLEHLADRLRHLAETGHAPADPAQAADPVSPITAALQPRRQAARPLPRPRRPGANLPLHPHIRQKSRPAATLKLAHFVTRS